jgi:hypothetical protein
LHWNDSTSELLIGKRAGSYPGMARSRRFVVHLAGATHATRTVLYCGVAIPLHLN